MCFQGWALSNISGTFRWNTAPKAQQSLCLQSCRLRDDCAAVQYKNGACNLMVSDGKPSALHSEVLLRLNNCSDQDAALNVTLPGAQYLEGEFSVMSIFKSNASYSRPGTNPQRQLLLSRRENVERVPESCAKPSSSTGTNGWRSETGPQMLGGIPGSSF